MYYVAIQQKDYVLPSCILRSLSVEEILLPRYRNWSINFRGWPFDELLLEYNVIKSNQRIKKGYLREVRVKVPQKSEIEFHPYYYFHFQIVYSWKRYEFSYSSKL